MSHLPADLVLTTPILGMAANRSVSAPFWAAVRFRLEPYFSRALRAHCRVVVVPLVMTAHCPSMVMVMVSLSSLNYTLFSDTRVPPATFESVNVMFVRSTVVPLALGACWSNNVP